MGNSIGLVLPFEDDLNQTDIPTRDFKYLRCTRCSSGVFQEDSKYYDMVVCSACGFSALRFSTKKEHMKVAVALNETQSIDDPTVC